MYDLLTEYFPDLEEVTPAQLTAARAAVVDYLQPHFADQDMAPGSVFGDSYVSPMAEFLAALSIAQNRLMSDLDLENVANGVIYSCKFVERYLGNFAVRDVTTLQSSGMVRLTFSADAAYTVNKGVKFQFGTPDIFYPRLPSLATDSFQILPSGSVADSSMNEVALVQTSLSTWAVDLPLTGKMAADVLRGVNGVSSLVIPSLVGIASAAEFDYGLPPVSLPVLADLARRTAYAASVGSRNSTRAFIMKQWPETKVASLAITGDSEMQRTVPGTALALSAPAADVYFRSKRDYQQESQSVRLDFDAVLRVFRGKVKFLHRPCILEGVRSTADLTMELPSVKLYSRVPDPRFPGSTGCGSPLEEFWLEVTPPEDGDGVILVPRSSDDAGLYAMFTLTYRADPLLEPVSAMLTSPDNAPIGVDVIVKAGPLITINALTVYYRRKPGTTMTLDTARTEIAAYINGVGWPELFSEAPMVEIMHAAGALRTQAVTYDADMAITPATRRFHPNFDPNSDPDWDAAGNSLVCRTANLTTIEGMRPYDLFTGEVNEVPEVYAASDRNVRYFILPENIAFVEQQ